MQCFEVPVVLEHTSEGVIASCDELNAVASGSTEEEALRNLGQAHEALMETCGEEIRQQAMKKYCDESKGGARRCVS